MSHDEEVWTSKFPAAMKYHEAERGVVAKLGGIPPIRLIPTVDEDKESQPSVTIKLAEKAKETYMKFDGGTPEKAIRHIMTFHNLAVKLECRENYDCYKQLSDDNKAKIIALGSIDANTDDAVLKEKESFENEIDIAEREMSENLKEFWSLFERLLHQPLVPHWTAIVKQECETNGYVTTDGVPKAGKRGKTFASIEWCIRTWLRKVTKANAAERHRSYMQSQIIWPIKHIDVGLFIERVVEMNSYLVYLPSLKDEKGSPQAMPRGNVLFTDIELCNIVLTALPFNFASAFWASKGAGHFPICVKTLKEDLELVAPTYAVTAKLVAQVKRGLPQATPKVDTKKVTMKNPDDRIPKKSKGKFSKDQPGSSKKHKQQKLCQKCAKWSPNSMQTHNTADCRKWNEDGTSKFSKSNKRGNFKSNNAHAMDGDMKACFAQMRKDLKKDMKKKFKSKKSKKKSKKYYDSSDSSDSSDSE